jgi:hypothetical protein
MIVERRTYRTKLMRAQETAEFVKEIWEQIEFQNPHRIYMTAIGPFNIVYHDIEFKDLAERQAFWAAFFARPEIPGWTKKWVELVETGGGVEILRPVE